MFSGANMHETRRGNIKFSQHAEMSALQQYIKYHYGRSADLSSTAKKIRGKAPELYVVRLSGYGNSMAKTSTKAMHARDNKCFFNNSMPCEDCQKNLFKYGIKTIKYTTIIDGVGVMCELKCTHIN